MNSLSSMCRPFTRCCGAPAAPKVRNSNQANATKAQGEANKMRADIDTNHVAAPPPREVNDTPRDMGLESPRDMGLESPREGGASSVSDVSARFTTPPATPMSSVDESPMQEAVAPTDTDYVYGVAPGPILLDESSDVADPGDVVCRVIPAGVVLQPTPPSHAWAEDEAGA